MPHFIIEHGNAFLTPADMQKAMEIAAACGAQCGFIQPDDIKVRLTPYAHFLALDGRTSFVHMTVRLLAGRTGAQKEALAIALRAAMVARFPQIESISVEVCDMDPVSYKKHLA